MPKATPKPSATLPSILDLGLHLAALERGYAAAELARRREGATAMERSDAADAASLIHDRIDAVRALIGTMPAVTLADAAVSVHLACSLLCTISSSILEPHDLEKMAATAERMVYAALPVVAEAASLDLEALDFDSSVELGRRRFAGLELVA